MNFFNENITIVLSNKRILRKWISEAIEREGKEAGDINFIFCNDDYLLELNFKYLKHNTLTDILTFSLDDEDGILCGDIYISLPRVKENAIKFNQKLQDEVHRIMIHGILHLAGYKDKTKREKFVMRIKEDYYLELLYSMLNVNDPFIEKLI